MSQRIYMQRVDPSTPWGFRLQGGREFGAPLAIQRVSPNGMAERHGLKAGDFVLAIGGDRTGNWTHQQAQQAIIRCGNDMELEIGRGGFGGSLPITNTIISSYQAPQHNSPPVNYGSYSPRQMYPSNSPQPQMAQQPGASTGSYAYQPLSPGRKTQTTWTPASAAPAYNQQPAYQPQPAAYQPQPAAYQPQPAAYQPQPAAYQPQPAAYQPQPAAYQPQPAAYQPQPAAYQPQPSYHPEPNAQAPYGRPFDSQPAPIVSNHMQAPAPAPRKAPESISGKARRGDVQRKQPSVRPTSVPICANCNCQIRGPFLIAVDKCFCPNHFYCCVCSRNLEDCGFVEDNASLYCENDYVRLLAPKCAKCNGTITGESTFAMDRYFHHQCFLCSHCNQVIAGKKFRVEDDRPYCEKDWGELFFTKCTKCHESISPADRFIEALGGMFHADCFRCATCSTALEGKPFAPKDGKAYCKAHARRF